MDVTWVRNVSFSENFAYELNEWSFSALFYLNVRTHVGWNRIDKLRERTHETVFICSHESQKGIRYFQRKSCSQGSPSETSSLKKRFLV